VVNLSLILDRTDLGLPEHWRFSDARIVNRKPKTSRLLKTPVSDILLVLLLPEEIDG